MKNIGLILWLIGCLFTCRGYALYMGDPLSPAIPADGLQAAREQPVEFRLGYQGDCVWERSFVSGNTHSDGFSSNSQMGTATLALYRRFLVRIQAGGTAVDFTWRRPQMEQWHLQTHQNATIGGCVEGILFQKSDISISCSGAFQRAFLQIQNETLNAVPVTSFSRKGHWTEWQVALGVSRKLGLVAPYAGVKAGNSYLHLAGRHWQARHTAGLVLGCSLVPYAVLVLHIEVRLFDENAGTLAGEISF